MQSGSHVSLTAKPVQHGVQFYDADPAAWAKSVARFLSDGLEGGEAVLVFTTPERKIAITRQLKATGCQVNSAESDGRLVFRDAAEILTGILAEGELDWDGFESIWAAELQRLGPHAAEGGLRVYGDIVGILWSAQQFSAAIRLEDYWNRIQRSSGIQVLCGYPINIFTDDFVHDHVDGILCAHTHMVPTGEDHDLQDALTRAIYEVAGPDGIELEHLVQSQRDSFALMPPPEAAILELRSKLPEQAHEILGAARLYYQTERRFRAMLESSSDGILLIDREANIRYTSSSTTRVVGYEPGELAGRNVLGLVHPDDLESARNMLTKVSANPRSPVRSRMRLLGRDRHWCSAETTFTNLMDDPDVRAIVVNFQSVPNG